jgi:ABC-type branched-subunit amino acid transport system ATPase component
VDVFTGSAESIEEAIVPLFYKEGAKVIITGRDEPNEWLAPQIINVLLFNLIKEVSGKRGRVLLAERNLKFCLRLSDWGLIIR